ncbi:hypothetical protein [Xenorhabdus budapestensis]|uniref:Uncharacterized protein n=1 Tax=Xenorhabdus budapestensis TaxID=290110 RepID=A0A2D0IL57_XENBU|nr:hypothetical protein [Xenorhabdus budapestensis]PHM22514.1 hypothetical protein Xbud_03750 [Xenorhabdus budapestensis]
MFLVLAYTERIKKYAHEANIPVLLLAGVAVAEAVGTPDRFIGAVIF